MGCKGIKLHGRVRMKNYYSLMTDGYDHAHCLLCMYCLFRVDLCLNVRLSTLLYQRLLWNCFSESLQMLCTPRGWVANYIVSKTIKMLIFIIIFFTLFSFFHLLLTSIVFHSKYFRKSFLDNFFIYAFAI